MDATLHTEDYGTFSTSLKATDKVKVKVKLMVMVTGIGSRSIVECG